MRQHGPWKVLATHEVYRDEWLALTRDEVIRPDGKPGTFSVVRVKSGASVLAVDGDGFAYMVQEFRYAVGRETLEVVSGGAEAGEDPQQTARRELKEELGIEASAWTDLGSVDPFTSMALGPVRLFLAQGLSFGRPQREGTEKMRAVKMPLAEAVQAVLDGRITHGPSCVLILKTHLRLQRLSPKAGG